MTILTRRDLFRLGGAGLLAPGLSGLAFAAEPATLLVVLHLRGGCDGLNLVSPADDPDFIAARVSELRVAADGPEAGHALANGPAPHIDFRLHAAAPELAELYRGGRLALVHAAGLPDATRSHFVAIDMIERGITGQAALARTTTGWLTRGRPGGGPLASVSVGSTPSGEFAGLASALAMSDLGGGALPPGGPQVAAVLAGLYGRGDYGEVGLAGRDALAALAAIDRHLARDGAGKVTAYAPEGGANYAPSGELARPLMVLAQLVKMDMGLATATVDLGGWDTHEGQAGRFRGQVAKLSAGLGALWTDLARWHDRMVVVVMSEFGRRLRSNKSGGTDHGRGGVMAVLGGRVAGGRIAGAWPGLATDRLDEGVDLAVANDYRQVLTEVLHAVDGHPPGPDTFPGFTAAPSLRLFG